MAESKEQKLAKDVKAWLREHAKQVKGFEIDNYFNKGSIKTFERKDLGRKGYEAITNKFKSFIELKAHYGTRKAKSSIKNVATRQRSVESPRKSKEGVIRKVVRRLSKKGK